MFTIDSNGIIRLSRGDNCKFPIFLNEGTKQKPIRFELDQNDELYFYIVPINKPFEKYVLQKKFTYLDKNENGDVVGYLLSKDTINLDEGSYRYIIRLKITDDNGNYEWSTVRTYTPFYLVGVAD